MADPTTEEPILVDNCAVRTLQCYEGAAPGPPLKGFVRIYFDAPASRLVLVDSGGEKLPIAYLSDLGGAGVVVSVIVVSDTVLRVEWTETAVGATAYELQFRQLGAMDFVNAGSFPPGTGGYDLTGLTGSTTYEIRVRAISDFAGPYASTTGTTAPSIPFFSTEVAYFNLGAATTAAYGAVETVTDVVLIGADGAVLSSLGGMTPTSGVATTPIAFGQSVGFVGGKGVAVGYDGADNMFAMVPSFAAGLSLHFSRERFDPQTIGIHAFGACTVTLKNGSGTTVIQTDTTPAVHTFGVGGGSVQFTYNGFGSYSVTSDASVLLLGFITSDATIPGDQMPVLPPAARLIGVPSGEAYLTALEATTATVTRSDAVSASYSLTPASYVPTGLGSGSLYTGASAVVDFGAALGTATSVADSNGTKAVPWYGISLLGTRGRILVPVDFAAFFAESAGTVNIYDSGGGFLAALPLVQGAGAPCSKAYTNNLAIIPSGAYFEADVPIGVVLQRSGSADEYASFTR